MEFISLLRADGSFVYAIVVTLRLWLAFSIQNGYIHPDEYFQSLEIVIGDIYKTERTKVWEFDDEYPIRNALIPYILYGIPCLITKEIFTLLNIVGPVYPHFLVFPPRLMSCLSTLLVDISLIKICQMYGVEISGRLLLLGTSCAVVLFGMRTFSNTVEMILFSLLLCVIVKSIIESEKIYPIEDNLKASLAGTKNPRDMVIINRQLKPLSRHTYYGYWQIALLTVFGIFNRPTFMAFAIGPIFFWLYRGAPMRKISLQTVLVRFSYLAIVVFPATVLMILGDTFYYKGGKTLDIIIHEGIGTCLNEWVRCFEITPLNFLRYNMHTENLQKHGLHPLYLHLLVNLPMLFNILGISVLYVIISTLFNLLISKRGTAPKFDSIVGLMFGSILIPLAVLSLAPHQEPRFLIPLILPLVFLKGMKMNNGTEDVNYCFRSFFGSRIKNVTFVWYVWILCNFIFVYFYAYVHQSGVLSAITHINNDRRITQDEVRIHVIPSYTYTVPKTFLTATIYDDKIWRPRKKSNLFVYPSTSQNMESAFYQLQVVLANVDKSPPHDDLIYFIFPTSLTQQFINKISSEKFQVMYTLDYYLLLHVTTEALPKYWHELGFNVVLIRSKKFEAVNDSELFSGYFDSSQRPTVKQLLSMMRRVKKN